MKREFIHASQEYESQALSQVSAIVHFERGFETGWQACVAQRQKERRKTVRRKPPVQQRKAKMPLKGCGNCKRNEDRSCDKLVDLNGSGFCSDHNYKFWKRGTSAVA